MIPVGEYEGKFGNTDKLLSEAITALLDIGWHPHDIENVLDGVWTTGDIRDAISKVIEFKEQLEDMSEGERRDTKEGEEWWQIKKCGTDTIE